MMNDTVFKSVRSSLLPALLATIVAGCATGVPGSAPESRAERQAAAGDHDAAAATYIGMAVEATGEERDRLTLLAVQQWLEAGDGRRARSALRRVPRPASGELRWRYDGNAAALALWEGRPDDALRLLEPLGRQPLPMELRLHVEALLADAWFQKDDPIRALELYRERENWLDSSRAIERNRQRLWAGLLVSDPEVLRRAAEQSRDPEIRGWLTLGALAASTGRQGIGWINGVMRWRQDHGRHPAMALVERMNLPEPGQLEYPQRIALLLPLTGDNATAGSAVQNGFFGGYFGAATALANEQRIDVFDTNGAGGAARAYQDAVAGGADFVVGPLLRDHVMALAREGLLPVPVLTLNYLPDGVSAPPGFYQFALSPEDEAVAAARRAFDDGRRRALALVPNNDWGRRLLTSFASEFESLGGRLLAVSDYQSGKQDFSFEIENLMLLTQSVQRYRRLRANLGGGPLQFDPRRRQDADFIFLAATAPTGRLLKSQLKFHYAGELPVYSTSRIYSMDGRSNSDLNGLMFADVPWIVAPQPWIDHLPALYNEYWPSERRLGRLHALGYDAYQLVSAINTSRLGDMPEIEGATGALYMDAEGRVHRRLAWARFENGTPVAMPAPGDGLDVPAYDEDDAGAVPDGENVTWVDGTSGR